MLICLMTLNLMVSILVELVGMANHHLLVFLRTKAGGQFTDENMKEYMEQMNEFVEKICLPTWTTITILIWELLVCVVCMCGLCIEKHKLFVLFYMCLIMKLNIKT